MNSLDLYARIEPLIGFDEEYERLYEKYLKLLNSLDAKSCLDIGCGNGKFLKLLQEKGFNAFGIDRSEEMIQRAKILGVKADKIELEEIEKNSYDSITAIGDVLNYMTKDELELFFEHSAEILKSGGYILADINTLYGFEEITAGVFVKETENEFLTIEADFDKNILNTHINLFEKVGNLYKKYSNSILQYYHSTQFFKKLKRFGLVQIIEITMFSNEIDKYLLIFKKNNL